MTTITGKNRTVRYSELPNTLVSAANGVDYAYRDTGPGDGVPLVLLQHFRGNLDNWDPALIDALAADRRVVTFDYAGSRRLHRRNSTHRRADGARVHCVHRGPGPGPG